MSSIIITGASRGIGYEAAKVLSREGHTVIALARNKAKLEGLAKACEDNKGKLHALPYDLTSQSTTELVTAVKKLVPQVDVLINNAGTLINKPFAEIKQEELNTIYDVNVFAPFRLIQALLPMMKAGSHILNISSMGGFQGSAKFAGLSAYSSSKGALATLSECLAEEFSGLNISVNCLCLGAVQTEMLEQAFPRFKAPFSAAEMGGFVSDFAVNGHKYFNGKVLPVSLSTP